MVTQESVTGDIMLGVMNLEDVNIVQYFLNKQHKYLEQLWQEYVDGD